ncbi:MAG: UvrD-helicase domain-containing protein [Planctomycetes bacterium]|nr:UvrD-helicase domain-containing protein [Planctomycetota bacterium]
MARKQHRCSSDSLLRNLNPAQREAVTTTEGPLLVLAGAGTGKTRVITHRVAYLLHRGVKAERILAVTFTNKAAAEMRERIAGLLGKRPPELTISTFHSLGARILRAEAPLAELRANFSIRDESDQISLLRPILREVRGSASTSDAQAVRRRISLIKSRGLSPAECSRDAEDDEDRWLARIYERYEEDLRGQNAVDFDDLIRRPLELLETIDEVRKKYQDRFRYILIDEYQDTSGSQYRMMRCLVGPRRNLCAVGDDDQSIYGFRGAEVDKILRFEKDFPGAAVVRLEENYRSTAPILSLASAVISSSPGRHPKTLRATIPGGDPVEWVSAATGDAEVDHVIDRVLDFHHRHGQPYREMAVLLRSAAQARPFEEKLRLRQVPYTLIGGQSYFDRKEIRDALAYWTVAVNPGDDVSLLRIINFPRRGLGATSIRKLDDHARSQKLALLDALREVSRGDGAFTPQVRAAAGVVARIFQRAAALLAERAYAEMCRTILADAGYAQAIRELYADPLTAQARCRAVDALIEGAAAWEREHPGEPFSGYLDALALRAQEESEDAGDSIRGVALMTLHSAKGLEFPVVFLAGVEEDILPHRKSIEDGDRAVEEERRLFYVGVTRARRRLVLTSARSRSLWGKEVERKPSRFISELEGQDLLVPSTYDPDEEASAEDIRGYLEEFRRAGRSETGSAG